MNKFNLRILFGGLLIMVGVLFLLQQLNFIPDSWDLIWALVFGVAGVAFLYAFWSDRSQWWPLIPGIGLISLSVLMVVEEFLPGSDWVGAIFLGGIGISFWVIYALRRENWWAVIPGGVLVTLAIVAGVDPYVSGDFGGGIFMIGLGLTFAIVGVLQTQHGPMKWAFIPAGVLFLIGIFLISPMMPLFRYLWPSVLILAGVFFIVRNFWKR